MILCLHQGRDEKGLATLHYMCLPDAWNFSANQNLVQLSENAPESDVRLLTENCDFSKPTLFNHRMPTCKNYLDFSSNNRTCILIYVFFKRMWPKSGSFFLASWIRDSGKTSQKKILLGIPQISSPAPCTPFEQLFPNFATTNNKITFMRCLKLHKDDNLIVEEVGNMSSIWWWNWPKNK